MSTNGSDSNSGSSAAPFRTFAKAMSVLQAGDSLRVLAGTYHETLTLLQSSTENAPIQVIGEGAVLDMQDVKPNGITINGDYIRISGFEISGAKDFGIMIGGKCITVENNVIHDSVTKNGVGTCGRNITIRNNQIYDNCGEGITVTRGVNALVENNTVHDNFSVNIYIDNFPYTTIHNNNSYCTGTHLRDGNRATGIALSEEYYSGWGAQLHDILIQLRTVRRAYLPMKAM